MSKNPYSKILKGELKEQYLSIIPKSYIFLWFGVKFCRNTTYIVKCPIEKHNTTMN